MLVIEYGAKNFDKEAWKAIDVGHPVQIVVRDRKRNSLRRALELHRQYFDARSRGVKDRLVWLKFGYYAMRMPAFWGIYNHAELAQAKVVIEEGDDCLLVSFLPSKIAPGSSLRH